eukprot:1253545-Amorphochlora_amoeboformis.AAC.1
MCVFVCSIQYNYIFTSLSPLERLQKAIKDAQAKGQKVGALTTGDKKVAADHVEVLAPTASDLEAASRNLYGALRAFDQTS